MTGKANAFVVVLEENIRVDDAEALMNAIRQLRGVLDVTVNINDVTALTAELRARRDIGMKLMDLATSYLKGP